MNLILLFGMGFIIGLSGALIPGPLLAFTIKESMKYGAKTGFLVIIGHFIVELPLVLLIVIGIFSFLASPIFVGIIGIIGAIILFITGVGLIKQKDLSIEGVKDNSYGPILGGLAFTFFNPSFIPWWTAVGYNMIWDGLRLGGTAGIVAILTGHWLSDLGWYAFVSNSIAKGRDIIIRKKNFPVIKIVIAFFMFSIGIYFLLKGVKNLA